MLVLARKLGQSIVISDNIEIKVIEIRGDQIRLGIEAPKDVLIHRKELVGQIKGFKMIPPQDSFSDGQD